MQSYDDSATDAGFHCVAITDPVQKAGDVTHFDSDRTGLTSYSVAATCENPETVMEWVNYWFTDEGVLLANYGVEGESYTMDENGKPQYTELMTCKSQWRYLQDLPAALYHDHGSHGGRYQRLLRSLQ